MTRLAALLAAFLGWGGVAGLVSHSAPSLSFLFGLAVGAGLMLIGKERE